jgi:hypothetical protein
MDSIRSLDTDDMERALQALAPEDRAGILSIGASFHRLTVKKHLERAERKVAGFEEKYRRTLHESYLRSKLDKRPLPRLLAGYSNASFHQ